MRIHLLTFSKEINYGATLQCYALNKYMQNIGCETKIIDIQLPKKSYGKINDLIRIPKLILFKKFWNKYLTNFTRTYSNKEDILQDPPSADMFIVGSDQVWNPDITNRLGYDVYFFSFVNGCAKKLSYAASFGVSEWQHPELIERTRELISKFEGVSVREPSGVSICKDIFSKEAECVCDPVFLLDSYDDLLKGRIAPTRKNEIVYFKFNPNKSIEKTLVSFARKHNLKIRYINNLKPVNGMTVEPYVSVEGWLSAIRNAAMVVTDSFHCSAFSILFHTKLVSMPGLPNRKIRQENLMKTFGLLDSFYTEDKSLEEILEYTYSTQLDYDIIDKKIKEYRMTGVNFLNKYISK